MSAEPSLRQKAERPIGAAAWSVGAAAGNAVSGVLAARILAPSDRGLVAITITGAGLLGIVCGLGTNVAFRAQLPRDPRITMKGFWKLSLILLTVLALPALVLGSLATARLVDPAFATHQGIAAFVIFGIMNFLWFHVSESLSALGQIRSAAQTSAIGSFALACAMAAYASKGSSSAFAVSILYSGSLLLQTVLAGRSLVPHLTGPAGGSSVLLRTGPKLMGSHIGSDLVYRADRYLLGIWSSAASVGIYAVATTPAELVKIPVNAAGQYALYDAAKGSLHKSRLARTVLKWILATSLLIPIAWPLAPYVVNIVFGPEYLGSVAPFRILMIAQVVLVPHLILSRAMVGLGATWSASVSGGSGLAMMLAAGWALMPQYRAEGAAVACLLAYGTMSITSSVLIFRCWPKEPTR